MDINWEKEVELRKEDLLEDLQELMRINSVRDVEHKTSNEILGPGPAEALRKVLSFGVRDGFITKNVDNLAGHIEFGEGAETLGILGHVDVVPAGDGWNTDPFVPVIIDGKLYGRGSSDDKGPSIAAYYGMKIIKELNLPITKKVRFIFGTDEESEWVGIHHYMEKETMPEFGFSPDANFPIINGEKGILSYEVTFLMTKEDTSEKLEKYHLKSFKSGIRVNMVPGDATAVISVKDTDNIKVIQKEFRNFLNENDLQGNLESEANELRVAVHGKVAHAQEPKYGINAATYLAKFLSNYKFNISGDIYLNSIANFMHNDFNGKLLGIYHKDEVMGEVTSSANLYDYEDKSEKNITINVRHPLGIDKDIIMEKMRKTLSSANVDIKIVGDVKTPHYVSASDPLVVTLLEVYEKHTGEKGYEQVIGGGTYGRILNRGVAYGALFPGRENVMHQANEYMLVDDILKSAVIYADAIYKLIK